MTTLTFLALVMTADTYANPDLLIEAAVLRKDPLKYRILDVRPAAAYKGGHIPNAANADLALWNRTVMEGKDTDAFWSQQLSFVGVVPTQTVVLTGADVREVCRAWWMLKYAGVKDVRVLNGGNAAYESDGGKMTTDVAPVAVKPVEWKRDPSRMMSKKDLLIAVEDPKVQIVDARSEKEFKGEQVMAKRGGHVPGAAALEWKELLDAKTDKFKSAEELKALFAKHKIDLTKTCTTYCQSGGRASVMAFALELMGAKGVRNYYKSWSEWGNADDTPVVKP